MSMLQIPLLKISSEEAQLVSTQVSQKSPNPFENTEDFEDTNVDNSDVLSKESSEGPQHPHEAQIPAEHHTGSQLQSLPESDSISLFTTPPASQESTLTSKFLKTANANVTTALPVIELESLELKHPDRPRVYVDIPDPPEHFIEPDISDHEPDRSGDEPDISVCENGGFENLSSILKLWEPIPKDFIAMLLASVVNGSHLLIELDQVPSKREDISVLVDVLKKLLQLTCSIVQCDEHTQPESFIDMSPKAERGAEQQKPRKHPQASESRNQQRRRSGPIFSNILIIDKLGLAPPHTQAVIAEVIRLRHIVIAGKKYGVQNPFIVIGLYRTTHPSLPRHLADLFISSLLVQTNFFECLENLSIQNAENHKLFLGRENLSTLRTANNEIFIDHSIHQYARDIIVAVRQHSKVSVGCSLRGSMALLKAATMVAVLDDSTFLRPVDIHSVAVDVLCHRIVLQKQRKSRRNQLHKKSTRTSKTAYQHRKQLKERISQPIYQPNFTGTSPQRYFYLQNQSHSHASNFHFTPQVIDARLIIRHLLYNTLSSPI